MLEDIQNTISIIVNSCDKYKDCWEPFFRLFEVYSAELKSLPIYLNTETESFSYPGLDIRCVNSDENTAWSRRVKNTLEAIDTPYVITFLDDFFLREPIDTSVIEKCLHWMENNQNIGVFYFDPIGKDAYLSEEYSGFCLLPPYTPWRCNTQSAIWRKDVLLSAMLDVESPWEWEQQGTLRNNTIMKNVEFYALRHHTESPVNYGLSKVRDFGILQGKWLKSDVVPLFREHGIGMDFSVRGFCEEYVYEDKTGEPVVRRASVLQWIAVTTRPLRMLIKIQKIRKSTAEKDKRYCALVLDPIRKWKRHETMWNSFDYKKAYGLK